MKTLLLFVLVLMSFNAAASCGDLGLASQTANCMQNEQNPRSNQHYQQFNQTQFQRQQEYQQQEIQQQEQPEQWRRRRY